MLEENNFAQEEKQEPNNKMAGWALAFGIIAMTIPIPVLDIIVGVLGIVFASKAKKTGVGGLAIGALAVSIIGTIVAINFTLHVLAYLSQF